jgi:hypothetical protein
MIPQDRIFCINCGVPLGFMDEDPNGDSNCVCKKCRAEENHDFDRKPNVRFNRHGIRIENSTTHG